jgi:glycosyltransferase involved in cell wall biosynthesis
MGVDLEPYQDLPQPEQVRHALGLRSGLTVGYTGHLYPGRGLELMTTLARLNPEVHFLWVGGEPGDVSRWKRRLETEGIGNITLTGFIPNENLHQYQAACEFLLMPYQHAIAGSSGGDTAKFASPMKVFEYLASGRVILSSDLPVLREILDESNSVMLPADEPAAWDKTLKALIQQPEQRIKLGNAAKKTALEHSWKARAERILAGLGNG